MSCAAEPSMIASIVGFASAGSAIAHRRRCAVRHSVSPRLHRLIDDRVGIQFTHSSCRRADSPTTRATCLYRMHIDARRSATAPARVTPAALYGRRRASRCSDMCFPGDDRRVAIVDDRPVGREHYSCTALPSMRTTLHRKRGERETSRLHHVWTERCRNDARLRPGSRVRMHDDRSDCRFVRVNRGDDRTVSIDEHDGCRRAVAHRDSATARDRDPPSSRDRCWPESVVGWFCASKKCATSSNRAFPSGSKPSMRCSIGEVRRRISCVDRPRALRSDGAGCTVACATTSQGRQIA